MDKIKSVGIINTTSPFSIANAKDSLDIALIMGSYEQDVHLYFQGDGVFQLIDKQRPEQINVKDFLKTFSAFEFYDLNNIYVCTHSLKIRGLTNDFHTTGVIPLTSDEFSEKLSHHHVLFRF